MVTLDPDDPYDGDEPVWVDVDLLETITNASHIYKIAGRPVVIPNSQLLDEDVSGTQILIPRWLAFNEGLI